MKIPSKEGGLLGGAEMLPGRTATGSGQRQPAHCVGARGAEGQPQRDCDRPGRAQDYACQKGELTSAASQQKGLAREQKTADSGPPPHLHSGGRLIESEGRLFIFAVAAAHSPMASSCAPQKWSSR
jgi:hypothetical protein